MVYKPRAFWRHILCIQFKTSNNRECFAREDKKKAHAKKEDTQYVF